MKSRLTAVLSVTGVLVAGSSAALVNTQVLRHTGQSAMGGDTSGAQGANTIDTVVLDATAPTVVGDGATLPAGVDAASAPTVTATAYRVGESGTVVLDAVGSVLDIVSVTPDAGWVVAATSQANPTQVRVVFETATTQVVFDANLLYGVVGTSVTVNVIGDGSSGDGSGGGGSSGGGGTTTTTVPTEQSTTTTVEPPDNGVVDDD